MDVRIPAGTVVICFIIKSPIKAWLLPRKELIMVFQQNHEMQLERTHSSGAEEWHCPICGRRFLLNMPPEYRKIILDAGDELAIHSGSKGGLVMGSIEVGKPEEPMLPDQIVATLEKILKDFDRDHPSDASDSDT